MTTFPHQDPCRSGNAPHVLTVAQAAAADLHNIHRSHLSQRFALGAGPHATLVSERWSQGQEATLLEILDAALEIADASSVPESLNAPKSSACRGRKRRAPGSHPGRE